MLIQKLKSLFLRQDLPDETKSIFQRAESVRDILQGLDELLTRNEVEFEALNREIAQLELIEQEEMEKIRQGNLPPRAKQNTLLYIKRLRKQMDNLQNRLYIYDRNIHLHLDLMAKIQDMEAMALRGVSEEDIDSIVVEFQKQLDKYMETTVALEAAKQVVSPLSEEEKKELEELEKEILSTPPLESKKEEQESSQKEEREKERQGEVERDYEEEEEKEEAFEEWEEELEAESRQRWEAYQEEYEDYEED